MVLCTGLYINYIFR